MKKSELKTGMIAETRSGRMGLIVKNNCYGEDAVIFSKNDWTSLGGFTEDLIWHGDHINKSDFCKTVDIVKVFKPDLPTGFLGRECKFGVMHPIWERTPDKTFTLDGIDYSETTLRSLIKKATS